MRKHLKLLFVLALALTVMAGVLTVATAEAHNYEATTTVMPGCETPGYIIYTCKDCGDTYRQDLDAIGHKWTTEESIVSAATCGTPGYKMVKVWCPHCQMVQSSSMVEIPATGVHNYVTNQKPATCTEAGYYRTECSVCHYVLVNNTLDPLGHSWMTSSETPATCTAAGSRTVTCARCGQSQTQVIPATGHTWAGAITTPATCTKPGVMTYTCTLCGATRTETIPATGNHTPGGWEYTKMATCTGAGFATRKCVVCGEVLDSRSIPAAGHVWSSWYTVVPSSCTSSGQEERVCSICGEKQTQVSPALGHNWSQWQVTVPATSDHTGLYQRTCSNCHTTETQIIPRLGLKDTLCAFGLRLKDVGSYLNPAYSTWYMFTPFDASVEGMQTYELVVNDAYIVGTGTLTILNGEISFNYTLNSPGVQIEEEFFTIVNKMTDLHEYEPEELINKYALKTNTPYSISQQFGGDTNLVLYMCCRVRFEYDVSMTDLNYESIYHQALVNVMKNMLE